MEFLVVRIRSGSSHAGARYPTVYPAARSMLPSSLERCWCWPIACP